MKKPVAASIVLLLMLSVLALPPGQAFHVDEGNLDDIASAVAQTTGAGTMFGQYHIVLDDDTGGAAAESRYHPNMFLVDDGTGRDVPGLRIDGFNHNSDEDFIEFDVVFPARNINDTGVAPALKYRKDGITATSVPGADLSEELPPLVVGVHKVDASGGADDDKVVVVFSEAVQATSATGSVTDLDGCFFSIDDGHAESATAVGARAYELDFNADSGTNFAAGTDVTIHNSASGNPLTGCSNGGAADPALTDTSGNALAADTTIATVGAPTIVGASASTGSKFIYVTFDTGVVNADGDALVASDLQVPGANTSIQEIHHTAGDADAVLELVNALPVDVSAVNVRPTSDRVFGVGASIAAPTTQKAATDDVAPYLVSIDSRDLRNETGAEVSDGVVDTIIINLNEQVDETTLVESEWSVDWGDTTGSPSEITDISVSGPSVLQLNRSNPPNASDGAHTGFIEGVTYSAGTLSDAEGNPMAALPDRMAPRDAARPVPWKVEALATDDSGTIDRYRITFSEDLNTAKLGPASDWDIDGATGLSISTGDADNEVFVDFDGGQFDTGAVPDVSATFGTEEGDEDDLQDSTGNRGIALDGGAVDPNDAARDGEVLDKALPRITAVTGTPGTKFITVEFSESVVAADGSTLTKEEFSYNPGNNSNDIETVTEESGNTYTLEMENNLVQQDFGSDTVAPMFQAIRDENTNSDGVVNFAKDNINVVLGDVSEEFGLTSSRTLDEDKNGVIDRIELVLDSDVNDNTLADAANTFSLPSPYSVDAVVTGDVADDNTIYLEISGGPSSGDTDATPAITHPAGGLSPVVRDADGAFLEDINNQVPEDDAAPVLMEADGGAGSNQVIAEFSEPVRRVGGSLGPDNNAFHYDNNHPEGATQITGVSHTVDTATVVFDLDELLTEDDIAGDDGDEIRPKVIGDDAVRATSNNQVAIPDGRPIQDENPPETTAVETVSHDADGDVSHILVQFNENINDTNEWDADHWEIIYESLPTAGCTAAPCRPADVVTNITSEFPVNDTKIYLVLEEPASDTGIAPRVRYTDDDPDAVDNNDIRDLGGTPFASMDPSEKSTDRVVPYIVEAATRDQVRNGIIDRLQLTFSEAVNADEVGAAEAALFTVEFRGQPDDLQAGVSDNQLVLIFPEGDEPDTADRPRLRYDPSGTAGPIQDLASSPNSLQQFSFGDVTVFDASAPVIVDVEHTGSNLLTITFSETVESTEGGAITDGDIDYKDDSGGDNADIQSADVVSGSDGLQYDLTTVEQLSEADVDSDKIDPLESISDDKGNLNNQGPITFIGEEVDAEPPDVITDLSASPGETSVDLSWTAPTASDLASYKVRYNTSAEITTRSQFDASVEVTTDVPDPSSGEDESMTVTGLETGETYWFAIITVDDVGQNSDVSNSPQATTTEPDTTDPGSISGLAVDSETIGADRATLTWVAPGDDGDTGTVTSYEVKVSTSAIGSGQSAFEAADDASVTFLVGETANEIATAGDTQTAIITGLERETEYFVRVRAVDEAGNRGPISAEVDFETSSDETAPTGTLTIASATHDSPSTSTTATFTWSGLSDPESTIRYHYIVDSSATTEVTAAASSTTEQSLTRQNLQTGTHYLHVKGISAGGATDTFHFEFEVVEELSDEDMQAANDALEYSVSWDGEKNTISWTLPDDPPMQITGVQIYRSNSPYTHVETVERGSADFGDGSYVDDAENATADSAYLLQLVFRGGQSVFSGQGSDVPDTQAFAGIQPTQETDGTDGGTDEDDGVPTWVWIVLAVVGASILIVIIVAIVASSRRNRAEEEELVTAEREDDGYVWPEEEGAAAAAVSGEAPPDEPEHHLECPNCSHRFVAHGEKPLTTTCPNCGKKGTLN